MNDISTRIRDARLRIEMTQADLAERSGLSRDQITAIEGGKREVAAAELHPLAKALGVRVLHLLGSQDDAATVAPKYRNLSDAAEAADLEAFARDFLRRDASLRRVLSAN